MPSLIRLVLRTIMIAAIILPSVNATAGSRTRTPVSSDYPEPYINKPVGPGTDVWYCVYDGNAGIACALGAIGEGSRTAGSVDKRLPALVHTLWTEPARLAGRLIHIPLNAPAFDFQRVGTLADAVVCGARPGCAMLFATRLSDLLQIVGTFERGLVAQRLTYVPAIDGVATTMTKTADVDADQLVLVQGLRDEME